MSQTVGIINATDRDGKQYSLRGRERASLMEILRHADLSLEALCGGSCQCATCHIYVEMPWLGKLKPASDFETATLEGEASEIRDNSRLACQIRWEEELDGIRLTVAPSAE